MDQLFTSKFRSAERLRAARLAKTRSLTIFRSEPD
jgi:hypothetical protein